MKKIIAILLVALGFNLNAQEIVEPSPIKWYDIQTAEKLNKKQPRPWLIDVYTDWCKWCHYMMKTTYANKSLASYINRYFYPVRFNAETADTIEFQGKKWVKKGRANELARYLLDNRLAYPSTVFFDMSGRKYVIPGYLNIRTIEPILVYFAEDLPSMNVPLDTFRLAYMLTQPQRYAKELKETDSTQLYDTTGSVQWHDFQTVYKLEQTQPRLILVFGYVPWCYSCNPMKTIVFRNKKVADYINKHFYAVSFNAATEDTLKLGDKVYVSLGKGQPHEFAMYMFNRYFRFPALIFLDKDFKVVGRVYGFYTPHTIMPVLEYFASGAYKTMSYQQYIQSNK